MGLSRRHLYTVAVDVRSPAVQWVNNLEKDAYTQRWTRNVKEV